MIGMVSKRLRLRLPYYQRTHPSLIVPTKRASTQGLIAAIGGMLELNQKKIAVLSLPGPWWNFERGLKRIPGHHFSFSCCERDPLIFRAAATRMPGMRHQELQPGAMGSCVRSKFCAELGNCDVTTNGRSICLLNCDVAAFVKVTPKKFHVIYLDFVSPISHSLLQCLDDCDRIIEPGGLLAFSFMAQRESLKTLQLLHPYKSRITFCKDWVETAGYEVKGTWAWNDGSAMVQMLFKKLSLSGEAPQ